MLVAKIGSFLKDLDLRFFFEALKVRLGHAQLFTLNDAAVELLNSSSQLQVRRKCLADLDETADAMAAAAAMSQSQFE